MIFSGVCTATGGGLASIRQSGMCPGSSHWPWGSAWRAWHKIDGGARFKCARRLRLAGWQICAPGLGTVLASDKAQAR